MKDLNISWDTLKVQEENIGNKVSDILHSNIIAREIKERINKWDFFKLKSFSRQTHAQDSLSELPAKM